MTRTPRPRKQLHRALSITVAALALAAVCSFGLFVLLRLRERPAPTTAGWRARVRTLAGDGTPGLRDGASARQARFADPFGIVVDHESNVYVADGGASNRVRKITPQGAVTTLAGGAEGFADGVGASAAFNTPSGLALDAGGNVYVADTGNNRIRKITPEGAVTTIAGDGRAGYRDGRAATAQFDAPVGVAVDGQGNVYVADTYNDRIRVVTPAGEVKTLAGGASPGYADGPASTALFDTPCAVATAPDGTLLIADTGNDRLRKLAPDGQVTTISFRVEAPGENVEASGEAQLDGPVGLALTHDGFLYVTEQGRGRVWQLAPDGEAYVIAGADRGFADGDGRREARFNQPAGVAVNRRGVLYVADGANYLVRQIVSVEQTGGAEEAAADTPATNSQMPNSPTATSQAAARQPEAPGEPASTKEEALPRLDADALGITQLPWPLDPQNSWHEVAATMGEVRGRFGSADARDHLHSGVDIFGGYGATVRAVFDEKVASPVCNWGFGELNEGLRVGLFAYVHLRVGRDAEDRALNDPRFVAIKDQTGRIARVRLRRGARFRTGDALGAVNRMYHVHLNFGPPGAEVNPLSLPLAGFKDHVPPQIARDGIQLLDESGRRLETQRSGRLVIPRASLRVVVDAFDQVDGNAARRRLGVYKLAFQVLTTDGTPAPGFEEPRTRLEFDRLPPQSDAVKIAYAGESGITVYGSSATRFLYELTNYVRHGRAAVGRWDAAELPAGDYTLRVFAADFSGNVAEANRDLSIRIE